MALSDYAENKLLGHLTGVPYTGPSATYLALVTVAPPGDPGAITEPSGGSYARQEIDWAAPLNGTVANLTDVDFPAASAPWGVVSHVAVCDAQSGGNVLFYGAFTEAKTIGLGDNFTVPAGALTLSLA